MGNAYYNENDPYAAEWLRNLIAKKHIAPGYVDERDIRDVAIEDLRGFVQYHFFAGIGVWSHVLRKCGWPDERPIVTASCPCQPFSVAGRGKGTEDERHLWPTLFQLLQILRPVVIVGEQVAGPAGLAWYDAVSADLEHEGYAVGAVSLCAAGVGAPHVRQRLYWMGYAGLPGGRGHSRAVLGSEEEVGSGGEQARGVAHESVPASQACELADPDGDGSHGQGVPQPAGRIDVSVSGGAGADRHVADSERDGRQGGDDEGRGQGEIADGRRSADQGSKVRARSPLSNFWRRLEWIPCSDGRSRPIERGTFPLAPGSPTRVGRLRAYGNSLCAPQAEAFVKVVMEVLIE